jgi:hypothetical protein
VSEVGFLLPLILIIVAFAVALHGGVYFQRQNTGLKMWTFTVSCQSSAG